MRYTLDMTQWRDETQFMMWGRSPEDETPQLQVQRGKLIEVLRNIASLQNKFMDPDSLEYQPAFGNNKKFKE